MLAQTINLVPMQGDLLRHVVVQPAKSSALRQLLPVSAIDAVSPILPYAVVLQNTGEDRLLMVTVLFRAEDTSGKIFLYSFNNEVFSAPSIEKGMAPGQSHLVTMSHTVNAAIHGRHFAALADSQIADAIATARQYRRIDISLDSIVTSTGIFLGPDVVGSFNRIQQQQRAVAEVSAAVASFKGHPELIPSYLATLAATTAKPPQSPAVRDFYNERKRILGNMLQQIYSREGAAGVIRFTTNPRVSIHR